MVKYWQREWIHYSPTLLSFNNRTKRMHLYINAKIKISLVFLLQGIHPCLICLILLNGNDLNWNSGI